MQMSRRRLIWRIAAVVLSTSLLVVGGIAYFFLSIKWDFDAREAKVTVAEAYEPAATVLAKLCQSDSRHHADQFFYPAWMPLEIKRLDPHGVFINADGARIEFGGGFHHYGYELTRDETRSTGDLNVWILNFYTERNGSRTLYTFTLDKRDRFRFRTIEPAKQ